MRGTAICPTSIFPCRLLLIGDCFIKPGNQLVLDRFIEPFIITRRGERRAVYGISRQMDHDLIPRFP